MAETTTIIAGGDIEQHFERLGVEAEKTYEGFPRWEDERFTVWEMDKPTFKRLALEADNPEAQELWIESGAWWRECGASNLGSPYAEARVGGRRIRCWENEHERQQAIDDGEDTSPVEWQEWRDVFQYLCDHMGVSTERNLAAVLPDLARANDMTVGELLTATCPVREGADG